MVEGIVNMVAHPIQTLEGLAFAVTHPDKLWDALTKPYVDDWNSGHPWKAIGRGALNVALLIGTAGIGEAGAAAGEGANAVGKVGELAGAASKMGEVGEAGETATLAARTAEAAELARSAEVAEAARGAELAEAAKGAETVDVARVSEIASGTAGAEGISVSRGVEQTTAIRERLGLATGERNVAVAQGELNGEKFAYEAVSGKKSPAGTIELPENPIFTTKPSGAMTRAFDTEVKILENAAKQLTPDSTGVINIFTERAPCLSCQQVIKQFEDMFPKVKVIVTHGE